jgi:cell wall-associated NlpC family hydrolase
VQRQNRGIGYGSLDARCLEQRRTPPRGGRRGVAAELCERGENRRALGFGRLGRDPEEHGGRVKLRCGDADDLCMRHRLVLLAFALTLAGPAGSATPKPEQSWARAEIAAVTAAGLMGGDAATFRPDDVLTSADLEALAADLNGDDPLPGDYAPVTLAGLDKRLVATLRLESSAYRFYRAARAAGLAPPSRFGSETVARLLGLRTNHPAGSDDLELLPSAPVTRAETAFSVARILGLASDATASMGERASAFALPELTIWQQAILKRAISFIGYPYVWAGVKDGFDCSGFVWAVYKLHAYPGAEGLRGVLRGRTTYQMSGEVPKAQRIPEADLQPADVIFFGAKGPASKPAQVNHMGIYLGNGWFIHSSGYGVALAQLEGWYAGRFAWGRRPLAEIGL